MKSISNKQENIDVDSPIKNQYKKIKSSTQENLFDAPGQIDYEKNQIYLQTHKCNDEKFETKSINYCRECSLSEFNKLESVDEIECRFVGWRKLKKIPSKNKCKLVEAGFLQVDIDVNNEKDLDLWQPVKKVSGQDSELKHICSIILFDLKDSFQNLMENELKWRGIKENNTIWKRPIARTRELCDQCSTSIFNGHFTCTYCGFSVCFNCYELRKRNLVLIKQRNKDQDSMNWLYCYRLEKAKGVHKRIKCRHDPDELVYVQLIPVKILDSVYEKFKNALLKSNPKIFFKQESHDNRKLADYCFMGSDENNKFLAMNGYCDSEKQEVHKFKYEEELFEIFDKEWSNKRPVLLRNLNKNFNEALWKPEAFMKEFGEQSVNLINCRNGRLVKDASMKSFWLGFENPDNRLKDEREKEMILKLKDWPTTDDFEQLMPSRFEELMNNLPIKKYTHLKGQLNLISYVPDFFLKPDLGPKLYIAYSSAQIKNEGTTNLHVDISDAVNLLIYVGQIKQTPESGQRDDELLQLLKESNCCETQLDRYLKGEIPGALWHLFKPEQADKIRTFFSLNDVKNGRCLNNANDPIHDQINYFNNEMLKRLKVDHGVDVFTVVQFLGDAIFIPAGAAHQVRNLNSCIKVACDFVSTQGLNECLNITDQFRHLSYKHLNKEDKLQAKNVIYHAVKECLNFY